MQYNASRCYVVSVRTTVTLADDGLKMDVTHIGEVLALLDELDDG